MKKIVLSGLATLALTSGMLQASTKFYVDDKGQVFTKPSDDRKELKNSTPWYSHADKLKLSVQSFLGYKYNDFKNDTATVDYPDDTSSFEVRRAYFQVKAYMMEDPKSYYRITLDLKQEHSENSLDGSYVLRAKYAYVFLNELLPFTGVEIGLAHRPWHDYEEHNSWYYRSIAETFVETHNGAHLANSADFGFMAKTRTKYFDADYGLFNGEGYHSVQIKKGLSFEWRTTAHILGVNGKDKQTKKTYWDISFYGQYNKEHKKVALTNNETRYDDLVFGALHTVYNQPSFLIAAQYIKSLDTADNSSYVSAQAGDGYSINGEFRFGTAKEFRILGRYNNWTPDLIDDAMEKEQRTYIGGFAWKQNKNIEWVANTTVTDNEKGSAKEKYNSTAYMITAEVKF